jgi:hypothetical protein
MRQGTSGCFINVFHAEPEFHMNEGLWLRLAVNGATQQVHFPEDGSRSDFRNVVRPLRIGRWWHTTIIVFLDAINHRLKYVVAHLVETLRYKPEGRGFFSRIIQLHNTSGRTMVLAYISWGKDGRCIGPTTLPPSCAVCLEIWEPQPPGTLSYVSWLYSQLT